MASKKISELTAKTPLVTDLLAVADPATGIAGKSDCGQVTYAGMNMSKVIPFSGSFAFQPTTVTLSANRNNFAIGANAFVRMSSTGNYDLTGLVPLVTAETNMGRIIYIVNIGSNTINLKHESSLSDAENRFITHNGNQVSMNAGHLVFGIYDIAVSRWRIWDLT
jgi:hypothetical protein